MQCKLRLKSGKENTFTTSEGCFNFRTSTLKRHMSSKDHSQSLTNVDLQEKLKESVARMAGKASESIQEAMATVYLMAKEHLAMHKYKSVLELQCFNKCESHIIELWWECIIRLNYNVQRTPEHSSFLY